MWQCGHVVHNVSDSEDVAKTSATPLFGPIETEPHLNINPLLTEILCTAEAGQGFLATVTPYYALYRSNCNTVDSFYACRGSSWTGIIESPQRNPRM
jgi:hypothetical protein